MSRTLSMNSGSGDSLNVSLRCGCKPKARQMRLTVLWLRPHCRAIARVLQCVASRGVVSSVNVTTCSTAASVTVRGAPGRGSSSNPSSRLHEEATPPLADGLLGHAQLARHRGVRLPGRAARGSGARAAPSPARSSDGGPSPPASRVRPRSASPAESVGHRRMGVLLSTWRTHAIATLFHELRTQDTSTTVSQVIGSTAARVRTSDRAGHGARPERAGGTSWRSRWRHDVQAAPGAPRGVKPLGRRAGRRKDRGSGGERAARAAARNAYAAIHKAP